MDLVLFWSLRAHQHTGAGAVQTGTAVRGIYELSSCAGPPFVPDGARCDWPPRAEVALILGSNQRCAHLPGCAVRGGLALKCLAAVKGRLGRTLGPWCMPDARWSPASVSSATSGAQSLPAPITTSGRGACPVRGGPQRPRRSRPRAAVTTRCAAAASAHAEHHLGAVVTACAEFHLGAMGLAT